MKKEPTRCPWATASPMIEYHDEEWGVPLHDDRRLFEMLILEGAQAGLSWETVLRKRDRYRKVFHDFEPRKVAAMSPAQIETLLQDPGIIRNRAKVESAVDNARALLDLQKEHVTFDAYLWRFVGGTPIAKRRRSRDDLPASTPESEALSKDLRARGFRFVGPTICYAFMQATGMVNDHLLRCAWHDHPGLSPEQARSAVSKG